MANEPLTAAATISRPVEVQADWSVRNMYFAFAEGPGGPSSLQVTLGVRGDDGVFLPGVSKQVSFTDTPSAPDELERTIGTDACTVALTALVQASAAAERNGVEGMTIRDAGVAMIKARWGREAAAQADDLAQQQAALKAREAALQAELDLLKGQAG